MSKVIALFLCLSLMGCATMQRDAARGKIHKLDLGMSKQQVVELMGNPYRTEIKQGKEKTLLVYLYWTDLKHADNAITDDELTPLVFDENKLIGWGWSFLEDTVQKYELRMR